MIPPRTHPGQRYHIPLFTKLMLDAGVDENLVRRAAEMAYNYREVYDLMERWWYMSWRSQEYLLILRYAVDEYSSAPWYRRAWIRIQWFLEGIQDESK